MKMPRSTPTPNFRDDFLDDLDALGTLIVDDTLDWDRMDMSDIDSDCGAPPSSDDDRKLPASSTVGGRTTRLKDSTRANATSTNENPTPVARRRPSGKTLEHLQHFRLLVAEAKERDIKAREEALLSERSDLRKRKREMDDREWEQTVRQRVLNRHEQVLKDREVSVTAEKQKLLEKEGRLKKLHQKVVEKRQKQVANDCFVCFERPIDCVFIPCGHLVCCFTCGLKLKRKCPFCNQQGTVHRLFTA